MCYSHAFIIYKCCCCLSSISRHDVDLSGIFPGMQACRIHFLTQANLQGRFCYSPVILWSWIWYWAEGTYTLACPKFYFGRKEGFKVWKQKNLHTDQMKDQIQNPLNESPASCHVATRTANIHKQNTLFLWQCNMHVQDSPTWREWVMTEPSFFLSTFSLHMFWRQR